MDDGRCTSSHVHQAVSKSWRRQGQHNHIGMPPAPVSSTMCSCCGMSPTRSKFGVEELLEILIRTPSIAVNPAYVTTSATDRHCHFHQLIASTVTCCCCPYEVLRTEVAKLRGSTLFTEAGLAPQAGILPYGYSRSLCQMKKHA